MAAAGNDEIVAASIVHCTMPLCASRVVQGDIASITLCIAHTRLLFITAVLQQSLVAFPVRIHDDNAKPRSRTNEHSLRLYVDQESHGPRRIPRSVYRSVTVY
jgi:hypothetical protein